MMLGRHVAAALLACLSAYITGCGLPTSDNKSAKLKGLAAVDKARNIAVFGSGAGPGVSSSEAFELDLKKMAAVLSAPPFNFEVRMRGNLYPQELAQEISKAAEELAPDGTLLFFFSGHGSVGQIHKGRQSMSAAQLNAAAAKGNYARFTAIIEACNSGSFARGSNALTLKPNYKSLLVMTAATASESSADNGTDSYFPNYLQKYLVELAKNPAATVRDLTQKVFQAAKRANPGQSGDMNALPASILEEPVFRQDSQIASDRVYISLAPSTSISAQQIVFASVFKGGNDVVALCSGLPDTCKAKSRNDTDLVWMDPFGQTADRIIYKARAGVRLDFNPSVTVLVFSGDNATRATKSASVKFSTRALAQN